MMPHRPITERDLLALAGVVGLERISPELAYWMTHGHRPTWEWHLAWLLPALGFFVVICILVEVDKISGFRLRDI